MNVYKWIVVGYFLFSVAGLWYMVDRPRRTLSVAAAWSATIVLVILTVLVVLS